jgi:ABC-type dipeptide/oligopeptide/nickel transport system permease component
MFRYALKRIGIGVLVVITASIILFAIMKMMPGDPIRMIADPRLPEEALERLRERWGLDKPAYVQYLSWVKNIMRGDFGQSIASGQTVRHLIESRMPYTLGLAGLAMALRYIIAVPLGLIAAVHAGSRLDRALVLSTTFLTLVPGFWLGIILMIVLAVNLKLLPISGYQGPISLVLPLLTMLLPGIGGTLRIARSEVLETVREPYVTTAYAKGLGERAVQVKHVLRNALIPVTVSFFLSAPWIISGSVIIENVFAWPGMGRLVWSAIQSQDYPVVQGVFIIITILTVLCNVIADLLSGLLDPRIRIEIEEAAK